MSETMLDGVKDEECRSAIFVPIIIKDKAIGVISVQCYKKNQYNLKDLSTLRIISSFIGIALENARLYKRIQYLAIYDDLLNIFNKREIMRRGYDVYSGIEGTNQSIASVMMDIDDFKKVNDTYGHLVGDEVIKKVATTIKNSIKSDDSIGRYGGEEFLIFLSCKELEDYEIFIERLREQIEKMEISVGDKTIKVTVSVGVAITKGNKMPLKKLINYADNELYKAKRDGKNKVCIINVVDDFLVEEKH